MSSPIMAVPSVKTTPLNTVIDQQKRYENNMIESALQHHKQQRSLATVGSGRYPPVTLSILSNVAEQFVQNEKTQKIHATATAARTERRTCRTFANLRPCDSDGKRSNTSNSNTTNTTTSGTRTTCCCQNDQKCTERKEQNFIEETATICMHFVFGKLTENSSESCRYCGKRRRK